MDGFFDRAAQHGPISGSGPSYNRSLQLFNQSIGHRNQVGIWRRAPAAYKVDDGDYIDPDWFIYDYGQGT